MSNKEFILKFYEEVFNGHDLTKAKEYLHEDYIQHNPNVEQGLKGFVNFFTRMFGEINPNFHLDIQFLMEEDDKVMVYHKNVNPDGSVNANVVDIYRLEDGKCKEHWDVLQRF